MGRQEANEQFLITSFLDGSNAAYIEQLYARYQEDPSSVSDEWQAFFKALGLSFFPELWSMRTEMVAPREGGDYATGERQ